MKPKGSPTRWFPMRREMRAKRQVVEGVISQIKLFYAGSVWRTLTCVLVYVYDYAFGYSYYRRGELEVYFLTQRLI